MKKRVLLLIGVTLFAGKYYYEPTLPQRYTPDSGRLLAAANCFQCHGTFGISKTKWDSIVNEEAKEFFENKHPIMKAQVKGFTKQEVYSIFDYLHSLKVKKVKSKTKWFFWEREEEEED